LKEKGPDYEIFHFHDAPASLDGKSVAGVRSRYRLIRYAGALAFDEFFVGECHIG